MWHLQNKTPFQPQRTFTRDLKGREIWLVALKATYDIAPNGTLSISDTQPQVCLTPEYYAAPGTSSIKYPQDLILSKKRTDILLNGYAYSPANKPVKECKVNLKVGSLINKTLLIKGEFFWKRGVFGITKTKAKEFTTMPLIYELAFGGKDNSHKNPKKHRIWQENPIGSGYYKYEKSLTNKRAPSVFSVKKAKQTAGFAAVCPNWHPRIGFAGTYDENWEKTRKPLLPEDFNEEFYQCAPADQQTDIRIMQEMNQEVELTNLSPSGTIKFDIPKDRFLMTTYINGKKHQQEPDLHTVIIEPDFPRLIMVWHTALRCHKQEHLLTHTTIKQIK